MQKMSWFRFCRSPFEGISPKVLDFYLRATENIRLPARKIFVREGRRIQNIPN